jgi:ATP-dependent RNA helicase DDX47/RRP3
MLKSGKKDHKKKRRSDSAEEQFADVVHDSAAEKQEDAQTSDHADQSDDEQTDGIITNKPFSSFSLHPSLLASIASLKWSKATQIQAASIPSALEGRDIIGLAETGSGKTGAFAIPMLNYLLEKPQKAVFAVILAPTRELAFQIHEVVVALGRGMGANSVCIVGGVDSASQAIALARNPHVVVATVSPIV